MKRTILSAYQLLTGLSDTSTGLLLMAAPELTLRWMKLHSAAADTLPFLSYIGVFVLSVGLACLYGAWLVVQRGPADKLEVVWILTAITRGSVAIFVAAQVASAALEPGWSTVALTDGAWSLLQIVGLWRGWLRSVRD
jgi:hypothetical protein